MDLIYLILPQALDKTSESNLRLKRSILFMKANDHGIEYAKEPRPGNPAFRGPVSTASVKARIKTPKKCPAYLG
jgi:hypothetical protein